MKQLPRNPFVTVDIIIEINSSKTDGGGIHDGIVLIERKNPPYGWALPGGFVDYGESLETAAAREAREEICLDVILYEQFHTYSSPERDPRHHTVTTVFLAKASGIPRAADDAKTVRIFPIADLPSGLAFDHGRILEDYRRYQQGEPRKEIFIFSG